MSDEELTQEEIEEGASILGEIINAHADAIGQHMNDQFFGASGLFFKLNKKPRDRRPVYGPPLPKWEFQSLVVERYWYPGQPAGLDFYTTDYDSPAMLDRGDVRELRDMLTRWLGDES